MPHNVEVGPHSAHAPECTHIVCAVEDRSDLLDLDRKFFLCCTSEFSLYYFLFQTVGVIVCRSDCWDVLVMSVDGEAQATGTSSPTPQNAPIDRGMVKDALREILGEILAFRPLSTAGASASGHGGLDPGSAALTASSRPAPLEGGVSHLR